MAYQVQAGIVPIEDLFLDPNRRKYGALHFLNGYIFFRVAIAEEINFKPLLVADEQGSAVTVSPQSVAGPYVLKDPRQAQDTLLGGNNMPYTDSGFPHFIHGAVGLYPMNMRMYIQQPSKAGKFRGMWPGIGAPNPINGDDFAGIDADDSPYYTPTNSSEMAVLPFTDVSFTFWNQAPSAADSNYDAERPVLNLKFMHYWIEILFPAVTPEQVARARNSPNMKSFKRANELIKRMAWGKMDPWFHIIDVGSGADLVKADDTLLHRWGFDTAKKEGPIYMEDAIYLEDI